MKTRFQNRQGRCGYMMIEVLVYAGVLVIVLAAAYLGLDRCLTNSVALRRSVDDFGRAMRVGERWRADIRCATRVEWGETQEGRILRLQGGQGEVDYRPGGTNLLRKVGAGPWVPVLGNLHEISFEPDPREKVTAWRCDLELVTHSKTPRFKPVFTFIAVPANPATP